MHCGRLAPWQRPHDAASSIRAPSGASVVPHPCRPVRDRPQDRPEVAQAARHGGRADGTQTPQHGADRGRGGDRRRVPAPHAPAARRRPGLPQREHPQAHPQRAAPLPGAPRHLPAAQSRAEDGSSKRKAFKETEIGYVHVDSCQLGSAEGVVHMFLAIDRVTKLAYVEFHATAEMATGAAFLRGVVQAFPYRIRKVLTDNGVAFTKNASTKWDTMRHPFDRVCDEHGIEHRLTKPYHPWTNGQAERMNRTVKDATTKAFHCETAEGLRAHVLAFVSAHNYAKHLKALRWRTPFQAICDAYKTDPSPFKINPHHLIPGPNN